MPIGGPGGQTYFPSPQPGNQPTPGNPGNPPPASAPGSSNPGPTAQQDTGSALSSRAVKVVGFIIAGAALVALADVAPEAGIGLTAVLGLGVLLMHSSELVQLSNSFSAALGQPQNA